VATVDGEVAGFVILISRPGCLLLDNVAVLPARALGVPEIRLYTNAAMTENLTYYPQHGYTDPPGPAGRLPPCLLPQTGRHLTTRIAARTGWTYGMWESLCLARRRIPHG